MPYIGNVTTDFNVGTDNINNDAITTAKIADGAILDVDVNAGAAIAGTKISPNFGSQNVVSTGTSTAASFIPTSSTVPANGLYLSAANTVALATASTGRLFIDASGNVGIGATPLTNSVVINRGTEALLRLQSSVSGSGASDGVLLSISSANEGYLWNYENAPLIFGTNNTERMRLDSSGGFQFKGAGTAGVTQAVSFNGSAPVNSLVIDSSGRLLVGTSTTTSSSTAVLQGFNGVSTNPAVLRLNVGVATPANGDALGYLTFGNSDHYSNGQIAAFRDGGTWTNGTSMPTRLVFSTTADGASSPTPRMTIQQNGRMLVGGTNDNGAYNIQCNGTGVWGFGAYVNGSDERLKENIHPLPVSLDVIKALNPVAFQYKPEFTADTSVQPGFIAQELQAALAGQDYLEGVVQTGPEYLSVAYQSLIPVLTKALQEAVAKIETLEAKVAALEAS
jgi:hypothetical protein